jgi:hypothetical protein
MENRWRADGPGAFIARIYTRPTSAALHHSESLYLKKVLRTLLMRIIQKFREGKQRFELYALLLDVLSAFFFAIN